MVELQILNKILADKNDSILSANDITADFFDEYKEEFSYIQEHKNTYGNIPDVPTFLSEFPDFDIIQVGENEDYLVSTLREEHLYRMSVPVITKLAELLQTDSYAAVDYLKTEIPNLKIDGIKKGVDIIQSATDRFEEWEETKNNPEKHYLQTGFKELDEVIKGFHCGEELAVIFARTGQGKSWVTIKMLEHAWKMNKRVGLLEPEMSANKTGFRFDTLHKNISNKDLITGGEIQGYNRYIEALKNSSVPFFVSSPKDFNKVVTVEKLKSWVESNNIDVLAIDGISYLRDQRYQRGDSKTVSLTNISEDLMDLSIDCGIPIIVVVQSNREGARNEDLELENIRDSDGIAFNASLVLSVQQKDDILQLGLKKSRNSRTGVKLSYLWDIDKGIFEYIPSENSNINDSERSEELRRRYEVEEDEEF